MDGDGNWTVPQGNAKEGSIVWIASGTGQQDPQRAPFDGTITGWVVMGDAVGSISIDVSKQANATPPTNTAPTLPDTSTDKISASAPMSTSSARTASGGASEISTWTTLTVSKGDVLNINVTSITTMTRATVQIDFVRT